MGVETAIAVGVGTATAMADYSAQRSAAAAKKQQQDAFNLKVRKEAVRQYSELSDDEADILYDSHKSSLKAKKEFLKARSTVQAQAAATGTGGQSIDAVINTLRAGRSERLAEVVNERDNNLADINATAAKIRADAINRQDITPIAKPNFMSSALKGISTGMTVFTFASGLTAAAGAASSAGAGAAGGATASQVGTSATNFKDLARVPLM